MLWDDDTAEFTFIDRNGNVTSRTGTWWEDSDGDTRLEFGVGNDGVDYSMAFTRRPHSPALARLTRPRLVAISPAALSTTNPRVVVA